jgi:hypothetical protein
MAGPADEIIVRLTADASGMTAGTQAAADSVASMQEQIDTANAAAADSAGAGASAFTEAWEGATAGVGAAMADLQGQMAALNAESVAAAQAQQLLADVTANTATDFEGLIAQESELIAAMQTGTISAEEYGAAMDALDAQTATLTPATEAASAAQAELVAAQDAQLARWMAQDAAIASNTGELEANTAAAEENAAAGGRGGGFRFHGLYGTVSEGLNVLLSPVGMVAAALGSLALVEGIAAGKMGELNLALLSTGDAAGVTGGEMNAWSNQLATSMGTVQDARNAYASLAQSGIFIGDALHTAGTAAIEWSEVTGTSSQQAASAIERMAANPTAAIKNLTAAQAQEVESLLEMGHKAAAGRVAVSDLSADLNAQESAIEANIPWWNKWGDAIANAAEKGGESLKNMVGLGDLEQRIQDAKDKLHSDEQGGVLHYILGGPLAPHASPLQLLRDRAQLHLLESDLKTQEERAKAHADAHRARMGAVEASAQLHQLFMSEHPHAAAVKRVDEMLRHVVAGNGALPSGVYQYGAAFSGPGFEELVRAAGGDALPKGMHHASLRAAHITAAKQSKDLYDSIWNAGPPVSDAGGAHKLAVEQAQQAAQVAQITGASAASHKEAMLGMQQSHISAMVSMGTMGGSAAIAQEQSIADQIYQIKLAELEKEKALEATKPVEVARINSEIVRLGDSHAATMQSLSDKAAAQQIKTSESVVQPIISTFSQVTAGYVEGTLTRQQAELRLGDALVAETINTGVQMLTKHIAIEEAKTLASAAAHAERLALTIASEAEAAAIHVAHAVEYIATEAAKAAAAAFTAMAGIPIIGPVLAIAASVAAGAEVLSLVGKVASAEGGWDRVPYDGAPAVLHKDEMVLPADLAEGVRNMTGGGGNQYHYHIHANDAAGFEAMLRRNPQALVRALGHAHRLGATA